MMFTKVVIATVLLAAHLAAAKCPVYMHDVTEAEIKELTPTGVSFFMYEPKRIDRRLPEMVIDMKKWEASVVPVCNGKAASRFLVKYTLNGKAIERYVENNNAPDPKTCNKWNEAVSFLGPKIVPDAKAPQPLTCTGPWKEASSSSKDKLVKKQLLRQLFGIFYLPATFTDAKLAKYACKEGVETIKFKPGTVDACLKKPAATVEVDKQEFGPKDNLAAVWGVVKYTCTENPKKKHSVSLRASTPYNIFCDYNPTPSPPL